MLEGLDAYQAGKVTRQMKTMSVTPAGGIGDDAYYSMSASSSRRAKSRSRSPCTAPYPLKKSGPWKRHSPSKSFPSSDVSATDVPRFARR
jgi:hypothetical protein